MTLRFRPLTSDPRRTTTGAEAPVGCARRTRWTSCARGWPRRRARATTTASRTRCARSCARRARAGCTAAWAPRCCRRAPRAVLPSGPHRAAGCRPLAPACTGTAGGVCGGRTRSRRGEGSARPERAGQLRRRRRPCAPAAVLRAAGRALIPSFTLPYCTAPQVTPSLAINYTAYGTLRSTWCQLRGEHEPTARRPRRPAEPRGAPGCARARHAGAPPGRSPVLCAVAAASPALLQGLRHSAVRHPLQ